MKAIKHTVIHITRADIVEFLTERGVVVPQNSLKGASVDISPAGGGHTQMPDNVLVIVTIDDPADAPR